MTRIVTVWCRRYSLSCARQISSMIFRGFYGSWGRCRTQTCRYPVCRCGGLQPDHRVRENFTGDSDGVLVVWWSISANRSSQACLREAIIKESSRWTRDATRSLGCWGSLSPGSACEREANPQRGAPYVSLDRQKPAVLAQLQSRINSLFIGGRYRKPCHRVAPSHRR